MFGRMIRPLSLAISIAVVAACAPATPEQQWLADTAAALGGRDRLVGLKTLVLDGDGAQWNVGQDMTIDATGQTFAITGYRRVIDLESGRMRVQQTRTPNFLYFQGQAPQTLTVGIDGDVAYAVGANGTASRGGAAAARDRRTELYHHPLVLVRAALQDKAMVANVRTEDSEQLADVTPNGSATTFTVVSDMASHLPARIRSRAPHPNLGDVIVETRFSEYVDGPSGLKSPRRLAFFIDRFKSAELRLTPGDGADSGDLAAPEAVRAAAAPTPPAPSVAAEAVAPGVWFLAGQSHHSVLIEFADHLMLVEAPQSEARTRAVIAKARELVPAKPLTQLVSSHFHFDHSAGLRAAVAEGLTVITHRDNVAYYEEAAKRPFTIEPDALATSNRSASVEGVDDARVIEDKTRRVELYHISGNPHADTLLMVYLPKERVLIQADAFSPGSAVQPYAPNLLEQIRARKLPVDRMVPLHGTIVPFKDLVGAVPAS
jgi:glyoxylase-like metal-dependent hydrolase (beta-lactamase superfamily II)